METLYPYVFEGTEFSFGFCNFLGKMRILIDILLKENVCEKWILIKLNFTHNFFAK